MLQPLLAIAVSVAVATNAVTDDAIDVATSVGVVDQYHQHQDDE